MCASLVTHSPWDGISKYGDEVEENHLNVEIDLKYNFRKYTVLWEKLGGLEKFLAYPSIALIIHQLQQILKAHMLLPNI